MGVSVRPVAADDREAWERMFHAYADFYRTAVPEGGADTVWAWLFDPEAPIRGKVAVGGDEAVIGFTHYQIIFRPLSASRVCYLNDLYVEPKARGSGAGRALIDAVIAAARQQGLADVRWLTQEFNYDARRLYDRYAPKSDFILYSIPV